MLPNPTMRIFLGVEGGGTKTTALWVDEKGHTLHQSTLGPTNFRLLTPRQLVQRFQEIKKAGPLPDAVGLGLAGCRTEENRAAVEKAARQVWKKAEVTATSDLEIALRAAGRPDGVEHQVLLISGTGSSF